MQEREQGGDREDGKKQQTASKEGEKELEREGVEREGKCGAYL